jgi:hypothetical protein
LSHVEKFRVLETPSGVWAVGVVGEAWVGDPRDARAPILYLSFTPLNAELEPSGDSLEGLVAGKALERVDDEVLIDALLRAQGVSL